MEDNIIPDSQITATDYAFSSWRPSYARLHHNTAWSSHRPDVPQHIQIDLNQQQYVTGVVTQGKDDAWVENYRVEYTSIGGNWKFVSDTTGGPPKVFTGNTDIDTPVTNMFPAPISVSKIRIHPGAVYRWIHMRIEILGCDV
ncbi:lactadherin-like [Amphiura filiformis]|uniref:lactadherin-like n=1 Tax=Amphiura filiformis TaxID=82378 RepID=UPI003B22430C